jgi:hypothetical protein
VNNRLRNAVTANAAMVKGAKVIAAKHLGTRLIVEKTIDARGNGGLERN